MKQIFYAWPNADIRGEKRGLPLSSQLGERRELAQRGVMQNPGHKRIYGIFGRQKASGSEKVWLFRPI